MKARRRKRSAAWAMSFGLLGSSVGLAAPMALAGTEAPPVSDGTVIISNVSELLYVDQNQTTAIASGDDRSYLQAHLELQPGIAFDLSGEPWAPLGTVSEPFTGTFDGSGDTVSGLSISTAVALSSAAPRVAFGMFGAVASATIVDLNVTGEHVEVSASGYERDGLDVGGLVGASVSGGSMGSGSVRMEGITGANITVTATATGPTVGDVGGLVGAAGSGSLLADLRVSGVSVSESSGAMPSDVSAALGGIAGAIASASASFDAGTGIQVSGLDGSAGGLFGSVSSGRVMQSAATGSVVAHGAVGGLIGAASSARVSGTAADVAVTSGYLAGGLVGALMSGSMLSASVAEGPVALGSGSRMSGAYLGAAGGAVGENAGSVVQNAIAVGTVTDSVASPTGAMDNGGLIGYQSGGTVRTSYALGNVLGGAAASAEANGGLIGVVSGTAEVENSYAMGRVSGDGTLASDGGLVGRSTGHVVTLDNAYFGGSVLPATSDGVVGGVVGSDLSSAVEAVGAIGFVASGGAQAVGEGDALSTGTASSPVGRVITGSIAELSGAGGGLAPLVSATGSVWMEVPGVNQDLPILDADLVPVLTPASPEVAPSATDAVTVGLDYLEGVTGTALRTQAINVGAVDLRAISSGFASNVPLSLTGSVANASWQAPDTSGTYTYMLMGAELPAPVQITVSASGSTGGSGTAPHTPPPITTTVVHVAGTSGSVISSLGYNGAGAIGSGTFAGYVTERTALKDGLTTTGEGGTSSYVVDILSGSGVDTTEVSAAQQGQFAALYQTLGIIPDAAQKVAVGAAVAALVKAKASPLAIENYLVQLQGFTWAMAQAEAAAGFPIQNT